MHPLSRITARPSLLLVLIHLVVLGSANACITDEHFDATVQIKQVAYDSEIPRVRDIRLGSESGGRIFATSSRARDATVGAGQNAVRMFYYYLEGRPANGRMVVDRLIMTVGQRGSSSVSGRFSMFLDYQSMVDALISSSSEINEVGLASAEFPTSEGLSTSIIKHESLQNVYLVSRIISYINALSTNSEELSILEFSPEDSFFNTLLEPGELNGEVVPGHNGTQTKGFINLLNQNYRLRLGGQAPSYRISKITAESDDGFLEDIDLLFHISQE